MSRCGFVPVALALLLPVLGHADDAGPAARKPPAGPYRPRIVPARFQGAVDNPFYPLVPGTTFRFVERQGGETRENVVTVTHDTRTILGVKCVVVHDQVREKGTLAEETFDWYAQDAQGNVWYFGEATREFQGKGRVSTEGSWEAGVAGAQPGIVMRGHAVPGGPYRQEYLAGHAEDVGQVVAVDDPVTVPFGSLTGCLRTREWSLLAPGVETKWYARGIGLVRTRSTSGEIAELVSVTRP
jgi:hypothetical protein